MQLNQHGQTINHFKSKEINAKNVGTLSRENTLSSTGEMYKKLERKQVSRQFQILGNSLRYLNSKNII